jgi:hypothetical protein
MLRCDSGYLTYIIRARRITSGELFKYRKEVGYDSKLGPSRSEKLI